MRLDTTLVMETEYSESTTRDTAWVTLALDFRAATAQELALPREREEDNTMWKMVQHFKGASLNLMKKLKLRAPEHAEQSRVMASLGLGKLTAVEGRARLLRPEAVNRAIHALAIQALTTEHQVFMKSLMKLPSTRMPICDPHGNGEHEDPEPERKYLRTTGVHCEPPQIHKNHRRNAAGAQLYRRSKAVPRSGSLQQGPT